MNCKELNSTRNYSGSETITRSDTPLPRSFRPCKTRSHTDHSCESLWIFILGNWRVQPYAEHVVLPPSPNLRRRRTQERRQMRRHHLWLLHMRRVAAPFHLAHAKKNVPRAGEAAAKRPSLGLSEVASRAKASKPATSSTPVCMRVIFALPTCSCRIRPFTVSS